MKQLQRALDVLELVAEHGEVRLADVVATLGTPRASAYRLLSALEERGYVDHERADHTYRIGVGLHVLAARSTESLLVRAAAPALAALRAATGETVNLGVLSGGRIVYAATLDGVHVPRMAVTVGQVVPPHSTAIGKAILATLPAEERAALLGPPPYAAFTAATITDADALARELARTRRRGYAVDDEETDAGAACVAAAIIDGAGAPVAAISVSGITARIAADDRPRLGRLVGDRAAEISAQVVSARRGGDGR